MNNKEKIITVVLTLFLFTSIGITSFLYMQISVINNEITDKKADSVIIDTYISSKPSNNVVNTLAYEVFNERNTLDISSETYYTYRSVEGIEFVSNSRYWKEDKLKALYRELKLNKHGEEFGLLYKVEVHAEPDKIAAGSLESNNEELVLLINFPALPYNTQIKFTHNMGTINLYNGDKYTEVSQMAHILSHEYGHHYTFYHMFKDNRFMGSEYEKIRNIRGHDVYYLYQENYSHYLENHQWYLAEIAAEDYVQLMGSPMTKNVVRYVDVNQRLHGLRSSTRPSSLNGNIQENMLIPFANEVEGLSEYFHYFISAEPYQTSYQSKEFDLSITSGNSYHDSMNGPLNFTHYKISWDDVYYGNKAIYTLLSLDENGKNMYPIKTVYPGEENYAYIGTVSYVSNGMIHWNYDDIDKGTKTFIVTVLLPDGTLFKSNPLIYRFD